jgi:hypothetical protein
MQKTQKPQNKPLRLNYNVPTKYVAQIRVIAAQKGIEPSYWLHKLIEKALSEEEKSA